MTEQTAGWYGDPRGAADTWRWWDGTRWTEWLSREAGAPAPGGVSSAGVEVASADAPQPAPVLPDGPRVRLPVAVLVVIAAVIGSLLVVAGVVWISTPRLSTGPAAEPPAPVPVVTRVDYEPSSRTATVEQVKMTLPGMPYGCEPEQAQPPIFTSLVLCNAVVHANYNSAGEDWFATTGIGVLAADQSTGNLKATTDQLFNTLRTAFFTDQKTTVKELTRQNVNLGSPSSSIYGNITYDIEGVSSGYDRMLLVVIELEADEFAVVFSVRPEDTPEKTLEVLNASLGSLSARR